MQASYAGPLASYNSLTDEHLSEYFSNPRTFRHLRRMGLITRDGRIVEEGIIRVNNARKEHKARSKGVLANSIVNRAVEIERKRRSDLRRKLELLEKYDIVEKVKSQKRHPSGIQEFNPYRTVPPPPPRLSTTLDMHFEKLSLSSDQICDMRHLVGKITRGRSIPHHRAKSPYEEDLTSRYSTPVPHPPSTPRPSTAASVSGRRSTIRNRPSTAPARMGPRRSTLRPFVTRGQPMHSNVSITLKFVGSGLHLESFSMETQKSEVMVVQQHCGGNTIPLYKGRVKPRDEFTFVSKRHIGMPYGLSIYLDGMMDSRVSACCEYRHQCGRLLGNKTAHFKLVKVEGGRPCYRCEIEHNKKYLKERQDHEIDRVLGGTSSLQELTTPQAGANSDEEPPMIDYSPYHSGSETSQEDAADNLQSYPKPDTLLRQNSSEQEELSEVEDKTSLASKTSLANHSCVSVASRGSVKSRTSRVSVASSSKSSIHSHASSVSKASSRSSKSSKHSLSQNSSRSSSNHSLRGKDSELSASKVSVDESMQNEEKHLSDIEAEETADVDEEYNYADDNFEESEELNSQDTRLSQPENSDQPTVVNKEEPLSDNEQVETETTGRDEDEDDIVEEPPEEVSLEEIDDEANHQSEDTPPALDKRPSSPLVEESGASEEVLTPAATDTEDRDNEQPGSVQKPTASNSDADDNTQSNDTQSDPSSIVEEDLNNLPSPQNGDALNTAELESDANYFTQAEDEDKLVEKSVQPNNKESPQVEEPQASIGEPAESTPTPEDERLPSSENVEETEIESKDTTEEIRETQEEKVTQQGILLSSSKRIKPMRLSVSFNDSQKDDQSSKDLSASLTIEEATKVLQKSQSNVSLGSLLNGEVASSVDLSAPDDDDIPDLEQKISDMFDDGGIEEKTESPKNTETADTADENVKEESVESEQPSQETPDRDDDILTNSQTDKTEETQESVETLTAVVTVQDSEASTEGEIQDQRGEEKDPEPNASPAGSVKSGLSLSSSKSSLTSVSSTHI